MIATDYQQQALDFLAKTETEFTVTLAANQTCPNWGPCKPHRWMGGGPFSRQAVDVPHNHGFKYVITFKRGNRVFTLDFWSSIHDTYSKAVKETFNNPGPTRGKCREPQGWEVVKPTAYDVLACISGEIGAHDQTFEEWASGFDYDTDSIRARGIYDAVCDQSRQMARIWNDEELDLLREIS